MTSILIDCSDKEEIAIREKIAEELKFPDYYGKNWDAFLDCMSDLSWLLDDKITVSLQNIIPTNSPTLIKILLGSYESCQDKNTSHRLAIEFI